MIKEQSKQAPSENTFWNLPSAQLLSEKKSTTSGLTASEVVKRRSLYGSNIVGDVKRQPLWLQFLSRFKNPLIILLLIASGFSAASGDKASFIIIFGIIILSVLLDFFQQVRAQRSIDALRQVVAVRASVMRNGKVENVLVKELVPGDIVMLVPGDLVPADGRLLEGNDLYVNQAMLTGESFPVEKTSCDLKAPTADITEAKNAVFMGTSVISGTATILIVDTGKYTRIGQLAGTLALRPPRNDFEKGIESFGLLILRLAIVMVLFVILINVVFDRPLLQSFLFALALAVGLTPELLPMIMTITLSRGAVRMAKQHVIVKHLPAMHNLGAMSILCTDKTGTLTEAKIRMLKTYDVEGKESERVFLLAYLNSFYESGIKSPLDEAIIEHHQPDIKTWQKIDEVPFDFERRRISVLLDNNADNADKHYLVVKGAPEDILHLSETYEKPDGTVVALDDKKKTEFYKQFEALGEQGLRVLGVAVREVAGDLKSAVVTDETDLVFVGFVAFLDPPKESAAPALKLLEEVGVKVKIITGDNERVTQYVCGVLGMKNLKILTGDLIAKMTDESLAAEAKIVDAFCRITPQQKSRIIEALRASGATVGFLGDGINDAAALHIADVGISVNTGTDVAKEAADMILLQEDLAVIHHGILEGRHAVANTEKYILMDGSSNFGNMFSMAGSVLILPFLPMLPIQILLNNLIYDTSQTVLPLDNVDKEVLDKPIKWNIKKIKRFMWVFGLASSVFDYATFYVLLHLSGGTERVFQTGWFVESLITQLLIIFAIRTRLPMFRSKPNPVLIATMLAMVVVALVLPITPMGEWFGMVPLPSIFFWYLGGVLIAYFAVVEIIKAKFGRYLFQ